MKTALVVVALILALIAWVVVLDMEPTGTCEPGAADPSGGPSFEVRVLKPRAARPLFGLLPDGFLGLPPHELQFDHSSSGAAAGRVGPQRLELGADGWELHIETDGEGRVGPGTSLVFSLELADRQRTLRCRPADGAPGHLRTVEGADPGALDGCFLMELGTCEDAGTGKVVAWPPRPLTVRGSFAGLPGP